MEYMRLALEEAKKAYEQDEVPVGAVVVKDGKIIAKAFNRKEKDQDPTAHAEIIALREAAKALGHWRLTDCHLYVTLEPCPMCAGAIIQSRVSKLFFGAFDEKAGCCGTLYNLPEDPCFNHRVEVWGGILEEDCRQILTDFFRKKRK